jgi:Fic family protein
MTYFHLEKPPELSEKKIVEFFTLKRTDLFFFYQKAHFPEYLYWDKVKYFDLPKEIHPVDFWGCVKLVRKGIFPLYGLTIKKSLVKTEKGEYFTWNDFILSSEFLHWIDINFGGDLFAISNKIDEKEKNKLIANGIMEEAIASSQIEGANTTRVAARKFLKEGRKPRDKSEQMILNNYETIKAIEQDLNNRKLDLSLLFQTHAMLTKNTIDDDKIGRFRKTEEQISVQDRITGMIYHVPPSVPFVKQEMERLINYFNDEIQDNFFVHPLIKAIILHFWIGYLHPFYDGNGRMARAIFYWYLLKNGYWAFSYLPISKIIKKSPAQYAMSYLYTEQDDFDLSYFVDYNFRKIKQARQEFEIYLKVEQQKEKEMDQLAKKYFDLNRRQNRLLLFFNKYPEEKITLKIHMNTNQISKQTAVSDLKDLEKKGYIKSRRFGRNVFYSFLSKKKNLSVK